MEGVVGVARTESSLLSIRPMSDSLNRERERERDRPTSDPDTRTHAPAHVASRDSRFLEG
eukprot:3931651-Rhodomonas_salina.1